MSQSASSSTNELKQLEIKFSYKGVPTIRQFSDSNAFIRGLMGPFGSGKSSGCVVEIIAKSLAQTPGADGIRRTRWAVIRNTYRQLSDTTIKTFNQWLPPQHFGQFKHSDNSYTINAFENTEIEILFRALDRPDHVSNLLSFELTGSWVNEAREVPWPIIEALQGRVGRYPAKRDGGPTWHGIIMDTNPPDVDSKWFKFFEETKHDPTFAHIFKQPSGLAKDAENITNLPDGYYTRLASGKDPEWVKVYVHGEYGFVIDGRPVYPEYKDNAHCGECKPDLQTMIYRGWDFGLTPACVLCQINAHGQLMVFDEMVSESMGVDKFSDDVMEHCSRKYPDAEFQDIGDPAGERRSETDEKTCFQILHSKGIMIEGGEQSPTIRLESVRKPLGRFVMGRPGFILHPRQCRTLRKGFQGAYQFRRMQTSAERYTEKPDKNSYSHVHDALQYVCTRLFAGGLTSFRMPPGWEPNEDRNHFEDAAGRSDVTGY